MLGRRNYTREELDRGKDGNPLNEVEMISNSLMNNSGTLRSFNVIKCIPGQSVLKLHVGDKTRLTQAGFERPLAAFFGEIERKCLSCRPRAAGVRSRR